MARIRTLKPEHKQHRKIGILSDAEYRLWVGMLTEADDDGRLVADPEQLRALVWGYHPDVRSEHVAAHLCTLAAKGLLILYRGGPRHARTQYAAFPSWRDHQKLDRHHYTPSRLPAPGSKKSRQRLSVDSQETPGSQGREGNLTTQGREGRGLGRGTEPRTDVSLLSSSPPDPQRGDYTAVVERLEARVKGQA